MIALLLFAAAAPYWCWDAVAEVDGYNVYWHEVIGEWELAEMASTWDTCLFDISRDPLPGELIYYVVTSYNEYGESPTEHDGEPAPVATAVEVSATATATEEGER